MGNVVFKRVGPLIFEALNSFCMDVVAPYRYIYAIVIILATYLFIGSV